VVQHHSATPEAFAPKPVRDAMKHESDVVLLLLAEHRRLLKVVPFQQDGATWYGIHAMKSPVISYLRGKWVAPNGLGQSNISAYTEYPDERGTRLIQHPESFVDWAKRVAQWVRKSTPFFYQYRNYRITAKVQEQLKHGLQLAP
jgi:hypothetical protein